MNSLLIYNPIDISKNQWFINHFIKTSKKYGINMVLTSTDDLYHDSKISINLPFQPDFVINRSRDFLISDYFEMQGIRSFNPSNIIKICNDKDLTYQYFLSKGIPFLPYETISIHQILADDYSCIINIANTIGYPLVLKPSEGHGGAFVSLITDEDTLIKELILIKNSYRLPEFIYKSFILQKCASDTGRDLRVYMLSKSVVAGIMRSSDSDFRANFSLGGKSEVHELTNEEMDLVEKLIPILSFDLIGIDFVYDNGKPVLNELEDAVGCRMLYSNTNIDIVETYLNYILDKIKSPKH